MTPRDRAQLFLLVRRQAMTMSILRTKLRKSAISTRQFDEGMALAAEFSEMMHSRGEMTPDEDRLEDAVAFVGVSKFPARVTCALLGWSAYKDAVARALATKETK